MSKRNFNELSTEVTLFHPRTFNGVFSSQIFNGEGKRLQFQLDLSDNPTGLSKFCQLNPSSHQLCFDIPDNEASELKPVLSNLSDRVLEEVLKSFKGTEVGHVVPAIQQTKTGYPHFLKTQIPKTDLSNNEVKPGFFISENNEQLSFLECREKQLVYLDMFAESVYCKEGNMGVKFNLIQAVFNNQDRVHVKNEIQARPITDVVSGGVEITKPLTPNSNGPPLFNLQSTDGKMLVARFGGECGGLFPNSYSYMGPVDASSQKGKVKFEVYGHEETAALQALDTEITMQCKKNPDVHPLDKNGVYDCEGLIPDAYTEGNPVLISSKVDASDPNVCVDTNGAPVPLSSLRGCRYKYVDVYMSNIYIRKVKNFVTIGVCKKIKQIVVYPPPVPQFRKKVAAKELASEHSP